MNLLLLPMSKVNNLVLKTLLTKIFSKLPPRANIEPSKSEESYIPEEKKKLVFNLIL